MTSWNACADPDLSLADFEGEECVDGLDLASRDDIAAHVRMFERTVDGKKNYYVFGRYYLPELAIRNGANSQYKGWKDAGYLIETEGSITNFDQIEEDIIADLGKFQIRELAFDPFQAVQIVTHLMAEGVEMVEMRPTVLNFSEPMKELAALVLDGRFHHDGNPVLTWMISNVVCHLDRKDNIYPNKDRPENKIDGVVAAIMALGRMIVPNADETVTQGFVEI